MAIEFESEAALVEAFLALLKDEHGPGKDWTVYPETAGWDLLLVHKDGYQLGIEAKLRLNPKVVSQALAGQHDTWREDGPDYRAVLVPRGGLQDHMRAICSAIGLAVISLRDPATAPRQWLGLPNETGYGSREWISWLPSVRCKLPDYIPDVRAGIASPIQLTDWKIKAIRLMIVLERRGYVTRDDMKKIGISPTRWTDAYYGLLARGDQGYVACDRTPNLKAQHPTTWEQIVAEEPQWLAAMNIEINENQGMLL